jgi:hypothetical protein
MKVSGEKKKEVVKMRVVGSGVFLVDNHANTAKFAGENREREAGKIMLEG